MCSLSFFVILHIEGCLERCMLFCVTSVIMCDVCYCIVLYCIVLYCIVLS